MKVNIIIKGQVEIDPEHYRDINDDGKFGPIPDKEQMLKIISDGDYVEPLLDELFSNEFDHEITIED